MSSIVPVVFGCILASLVLQVIYFAIRYAEKSTKRDIEYLVSLLSDELSKYKGDN